MYRRPSPVLGVFWPPPCGQTSELQELAPTAPAPSRSISPATAPLYSRGSFNMLTASPNDVLILTSRLHDGAL